MRSLLPPIAAALAVASAAQAATVRVVPLRSGSVSDAHAQALVRATEAALRETSTLVIQPAAGVAASSKKCGTEDPACWSGLAARAGTDYGLVLVADSMGGLTADLVLVDLKARRVAQRRFTVPGVDAAPASVRTAVDALVPPFLRRGYGGFTVDLPAGARLKVDGRVVLAEPSRLPVPVANGRHEVDLLLPDGTAVLTRAEVAEGQTAALLLNLRPPPAEKPANPALQVTAAVLWSTGAAALASSLALASVGNTHAKNLAPCVGPNRGCLTLDQAIAEQQQVAGYMNAANILLIGGGALSVAGVGVFTFDLVQGGQR